jgi:hypothetical protein
MAHGARYESDANTMRIYVELSKDSTYVLLRNRKYGKGTSEERMRLDSEARWKFFPICCYLGDERLAELFK